MASVRKRKWTHNGVEREAWVCEYTKPDGKRGRKTFQKKKDADKFRDTAAIEIEGGKRIASRDSAKVAEVIKEFLDFQEERVMDGRIGGESIRKIRTGTEYHMIPVIGNKRFSDVTCEDYNNLYKSMLINGCKPQTARDYLKRARALEQFAIRRGYTAKPIINEVLSELRGIKQGKINTFKPEQVVALLEGAKERHFKGHERSNMLLQCFVNLAALCGLRLGEIAGMTVGSVNFSTSEINVRHSITREGKLKCPKTKAGNRTVMIPSTVLTIVRNWKEKYYVDNEQNLLFTTQTGKPIGSGQFCTEYWHPLLCRVGLERHGERIYRFHALRHFTASHLIECGLPLPDVAKMLGHENFDITLRVYAHPMATQDRQRTVAEKMAENLGAIAATRARQTTVTP